MWKILYIFIVPMLKAKGRPSWHDFYDGQRYARPEMSRVLVVDDEEEICLLVTQYLRKLGYEVTYSLSITEAVNKLSAAAYDLLFVDLNLADGSGYDVIKVLQESHAQTKVIVISAYDNEKGRALQKGASLFLAKPFTKKAIDESLQKLNFLHNT
jgi:two-component system OmpR family response regulator